ncbi:hypothetical protein AZE42_05531 [Rhizopogon vesiculosus]|uniref:Uncharacterized protein n=1 Tax=Rhizopogon vesiculosus TaxID=180088 RepID=A0A1J8PXZ4_9AGAM|nr:hypothetical protein AZE42_05531 [Rhizopogon vesiculosus]
MTSWILPGRENAPAMRYKAMLQRSFAFSRTVNPRNLEFHWYPLWHQTLSDLVADVPNLIVAPQYPVWFVPQDDEEHEDGSNDQQDNKDDDEDDEDNNNKDDDDDDDDDDDEGANDDEEDDEDEDDDVGELAEVSFALTVPEKDAKGVLVDFAIINVSGQPHEGEESRYGGWRITGANIGLLVEVKRFVRRNLEGEELDDALAARISEAHDDVVKQAAYIFLHDPNKDSVLAIAAAGLWWCTTKINRDDVKAMMHRFAEKDPTYQDDDDDEIGFVELEWSSLLRLDVAGSSDRLRTIYNNLKEIGVMEIPMDV